MNKYSLIPFLSNTILITSSIFFKVVDLQKIEEQLKTEKNYINEVAAKNEVLLKNYINDAVAKNEVLRKRNEELDKTVELAKLFFMIFMLCYKGFFLFEQLCYTVL